MTIETCEFQRDNCLKNNDQEGADYYQKRIDYKKQKLGIVDKPKVEVKKKEAKSKESK